MKAREALNQRFIQVYNLLVQQGIVVKNVRDGRSKSDFAKKLGTKPHIIDKYLEGERTITLEQVKRLCEHYNVSEDFMLKGEGEPFVTVQKRPQPDDRLANLLNIPFHHNILFTSVEAFSSNTVGVDLIEENQRFYIPGVEGDLVAFNINGRSMEPTISNGDMVICSPIEALEQVRDDRVYAVVIGSSVWVKRVQRRFDRHGNWTHLKLISDNSAEFDPFWVELGEVRSILKVEKKLTALPL